MENTEGHLDSNCHVQRWKCDDVGLPCHTCLNFCFLPNPKTSRYSLSFTQMVPLGFPLDFFNSPKLCFPAHTMWPWSAAASWDWPQPENWFCDIRLWASSCWRKRRSSVSGVLLQISSVCASVCSISASERNRTSHLQLQVGPGLGFDSESGFYQNWVWLWLRCDSDSGLLQ